MKHSLLQERLRGTTPRKLHRNDTETPQKRHGNSTPRPRVGNAAVICSEDVEWKKQIVRYNVSKTPTAAVGAGAETLLLSDRGFVAQFRAEIELAQGRWVGRVEHVVSG